jgi:hypothetical protein
MAPPLDLTFSAELLTECNAFLGRITEYQATLVLLKGTRSDDPIERWSYGAYGPKNLSALVPRYERLGLPLLHQVSGLTVAIPQTNLLAELQGKTLVRGVEGLEVRERDSVI